MVHNPPVHAVDERLPLAKLFLFGLQHVLVVAASPITAVFLVAKALGLSSALTVDLISATFLVCGLGTLLQSFGPLKFGARLPFIMVPGGAPVVLFVLIAQQTDLQTAAGATILTGFVYFLLLPVFARCLRFFPRIVIGTMLILVAVNLIRIYGVVIVGKPGTAEFGAPLGIGLALATVAFTVLFAKLFKGMLGQLAVLLGLLAGAALAWALGVMSFADVWSGPIVTVPTPLPFGMPRFDVLAALPLLIFSVISMAEATGQTIAIAEVVGKEIDPQTEVPKTIRGDAAMSVLGGLFGTSLIITSSENIGIVQATGIRSRFVTAAAGVLLVVIALLAPLGRLANAIPAPVVGGSALIVFSIIGVMGINLLRQIDLRSRANMYTLAAALTMGVLPIVVPGVYSRFPSALQIVLGNGLAMGALTAVIVNALFVHLHFHLRTREAADPVAHLEAAVNDNRSCH
ncbi:nucleobase:cation symporter [Burkholderia sp. THE68]|uniref:uracil-xanthine permease family protein n=1 Tax=Burkholderiaceae TaxID=119060 RepID=UPI0013189703|nr:MULTISPECIES: uracil-xanthine permease family protein [Burkholderiaceae]BBU30507.1 nucleobase:cation symporter [Burkholderia sp. THE68]BCQ27542.1 purine/pyrimidine permease [Caballeronia sp. NK8]